MNNENIKYFILDIETGPDQQLAEVIDSAIENSHILPETIPSYEEYKQLELEKEFDRIDKAQYAKQTTIDSHREKAMSKDYTIEWENMAVSYKERIQKLAVNCPFAFIKLARMTVMNGDERELFVWENPNNDKAIEKTIIKDIADKTYTLLVGSSGTNTHELVTFNGKRFDIPLLIERGGVVGATIPFKWLEYLTQRGDRFNHYDMMEYRSYQNTQVNKLSLSANLVARFGKEFAKKEIDFAECSFEQLKEYSLDEILKLEYWYRVHSGFEVLPIKEFLETLPKVNEVKESIQITDDDLPW